MSVSKPFKTITRTRNENPKRPYVRKNPRFDKMRPNFSQIVLSKCRKQRVGEMVCNLVSLACCLVIAVSVPAIASPQTDADYITNRFITDEEFTTTFREMMVKAHAQALSFALSTRSVKIKDHDKFVALLPQYYSDSVAARVQKMASDQLVQSWEPGQLESAAEYLRQSPLELRLGQYDANEATGLTLEEVLQETSTDVKSDTFKDEAALSTVAVMLIFLVVQEADAIEIDLKTPYVADMLDVNGVFDFPNRIVRNDLIRELRASDP